VESVSWSPDGKNIASGLWDDTVWVYRNVTDLNQVLIILILRYLKDHDQTDSCYAIFDQSHLDFLVDAWNQFNEAEQNDLRKCFGIDEI